MLDCQPLSCSAVPYSRRFGTRIAWTSAGVALPQNCFTAAASRYSRTVEVGSFVPLYVAVQPGFAVTFGGGGGSAVCFGGAIDFFAAGDFDGLADGVGLGGGADVAAATGSSTTSALRVACGDRLDCDTGTGSRP